jgi:hypothetical protein
VHVQRADVRFLTRRLKKISGVEKGVTRRLLFEWHNIVVETFSPCDEFRAIIIAPVACVAFLYVKNCVAYTYV